MTPRMKIVYDAARKDKEFLQLMLTADPNDTSIPPDTEPNRVAFAAVYYGYLIGKHGVNWKNHVAHKDKHKL